MDNKIQKQLVESACRGDIGSFGKLYEHYYASMVWLAYSIVTDYSLAEDIAQESFAAACEKLDSLRDKEKFAGWLSKICRNIAYTNLTKSKRQHASIDQMILLCEPENNDEATKEVQQAVLGLDEMHRSIVILHYYNDMSYKQIKSALGISLHAVKGRLRRARKRIENYLNDKLLVKED